MAKIIPPCLVGKNDTAMAVVNATLASVVDTAVNTEEILLLIRAQKLSKDELSKLRDSLNKKTLKELRSLAKTVSVRLTGSSRKHDLIKNSQAVKNSAAPKKGHGEKRCEIQGGGQEMAVMVG